MSFSSSRSSPNRSASLRKELGTSKYEVGEAAALVVERDGERFERVGHEGKAQLRWLLEPVISETEEEKMLLVLLLELLLLEERERESLGEEAWLGQPERTWDVRLPAWPRVSPALPEWGY